MLFRRFLPHSIKRVVNGFTAHAIRIVNGKTEKKKDHPSRFQYLLLNSKKARPRQMYISKNSLLKNAVKGLAKDFSLITGIQHRTNNGEVIIFSIIAGNSGTKDARLNRKQKAVLLISIWCAISSQVSCPLQVCLLLSASQQEMPKRFHTKYRIDSLSSILPYTGLMQKS